MRAALLPLTSSSSSRCSALQELAPQIKELQEKYKDDKQRQQQEMMKFYQENKVNPLGSCLPLLLQLPVFIALFYMLRKDLRLDICPAIIAKPRTRRHSAAVCGDGGEAGAVPLHPGPDGAGHGRRAGRC